MPSRLPCCFWCRSPRSLRSAPPRHKLIPKPRKSSRRRAPRWAAASAREGAVGDRHRIGAPHDGRARDDERRHARPAASRQVQAHRGHGLPGRPELHARVRRQRRRGLGRRDQPRRRRDALRRARRSGWARRRTRRKAKARGRGRSPKRTGSGSVRCRRAHEGRARPLRAHLVPEDRRADDLRRRRRGARRQGGRPRNQARGRGADEAVRRSGDRTSP